MAFLMCKEVPSSEHPPPYLVPIRMLTSQGRARPPPLSSIPSSDASCWKPLLESPGGSVSRIFSTSSPT